MPTRRGVPWLKQFVQPAICDVPGPGWPDRLTRSSRPRKNSCMTIWYRSLPSRILIPGVDARIVIDLDYHRFGSILLQIDPVESVSDRCCGSRGALNHLGQRPLDQHRFGLTG